MMPSQAALHFPLALLVVYSMLYPAAQEERVFLRLWS